MSVRDRGFRQLLHPVRPGRSTEPVGVETQPPASAQRGAPGQRGGAGEGVEYIFASSADGAAITGTGNLPDPEQDYDVDALRADGGLVRGNQRYYDGTPPDISSARPFQIRFRRSVPGQPAQNADIGSRAWTQEPAVRVRGVDGEDGDDGVDGAGVEYIFASSADGAAITGTGNLPDPEQDYDVDALRADGGLVRGNQRYYDGTPPDISDARPYRIRFRRTVPGTPAQNADIGSRAWTQEPAVRVRGVDGEDGDDGVDGAGVEYIFASSADGAAITGTGNLPDPEQDYDVDALRADGGLVRGNQRYYDGTPPDISDARPYRIRFRRTVPGTPAQNADIGSRAWTQEPAVRVRGQAGEDGDDGDPGEDATPLEYCFAAVTHDQLEVNSNFLELPQARRPLDSWGFDERSTVDGVKWEVFPPRLTPSAPYMVQAWREIEGQPWRGDEVANGWGRVLITRVWGQAGEDGDPDGTGAGREAIFTRTLDAVLAANQMPLDSWGYDSPGTVGGVTWRDAAPAVTPEFPLLWVAWRTTGHTPNTGDEVTAAFGTPVIIREYGVNAEFGTPATVRTETVDIREATRRALSALDNTGDLSTNIYSGGGDLPVSLASGLQGGFGRHGEAVTFSPIMNRAPLVLLRPTGRTWIAAQSAAWDSLGAVQDAPCRLDTSAPASDWKVEWEHERSGGFRRIETAEVAAEGDSLPDAVESELEVSRTPANPDALFLPMRVLGHSRGADDGSGNVRRSVAVDIRPPGATQWTTLRTIGYETSASHSSGTGGATTFSSPLNVFDHLGGDGHATAEWWYQRWTGYFGRRYVSATWGQQLMASGFLIKGQSIVGGTRIRVRVLYGIADILLRPHHGPHTQDLRQILVPNGVSRSGFTVRAQLVETPREGSLRYVDTGAPTYRYGIDDDGNFFGGSREPIPARDSLFGEHVFLVSASYTTPEESGAVGFSAGQIQVRNGTSGPWRSVGGLGTVVRGPGARTRTYLLQPRFYDSSIGTGDQIRFSGFVPSVSSYEIRLVRYSIAEMSAGTAPIPLTMTPLATDEIPWTAILQ